MSKTAKFDDAYLLAGTDLPMAERRVCRDAGAKQRRHGLQVHCLGNFNDSPLLYHYLFRVSAERQIIAFAFLTVVGDGRTILAILLQALVARRAMAARVHQTAYPGEVSGFQLSDFRANGNDAPNDLVSWHHRIERVAPIAALGEDVDASTAAFRVGYEDISHFNREYKRHFGQPPMRDVQHLRETAAAGQ